MVLLAQDAGNIWIAVVIVIFLLMVYFGIKLAKYIFRNFFVKKDDITN